MPSEIIKNNIIEINNPPLNSQNIKLYTTSPSFHEINNGDLRAAAGINFLTDKDSLGFFYVKYNMLNQKVKVINLLSIPLHQSIAEDNYKGAFSIQLNEKEHEEYSNFHLQINDLIHKSETSRTIRIQKPNSRRYGVQFYSSQEVDESFIKLYSCSLKENKFNEDNISEYYNFIYTMYDKDEYLSVFQKLNNSKFANRLVFETENKLDVPDNSELINNNSDFVGLPFKNYQ